ncbi:MAG: hypothetical protein ACYCVW_16550 [Rhodocyclaceae bacterium]
MRSWIKRLISDAAGVPCPARVLWLATFLAALTFQALAVLRSGEFSMVDFGTGMAAILAGGGAGVGAKTWGDSQKH